jgi:hypothetical protein
MRDGSSTVSFAELPQSLKNILRRKILMSRR